MGRICNADEGHDRRIEITQERALLLNNTVAHEEGSYEYETRGMQDVDPDLHAEMERENDERWANPGGHHEEEREESDEDEHSDMDLDRTRR